MQYNAMQETYVCQQYWSCAYVSLWKPSPLLYIHHVFSLTTALTAFGILLEDHQSMAVLCRMTCLNHVSFCHLADVPGPHQGGDCAALC